MEIVLKGLSKVFTNKNKEETVAVKSLDLTIPSGKLIGLLGPSGCGKSTTLFLMAGLHEPTEGRIFFGEDDVTDLPPERRGIGLVFQNYALYPHMTVQQNIMFPLENLKVPKEEALMRAQEMADLVGIGDLMNRKPKQLSGGQQQRVAIARALVKKPQVLLLDEPLSNLDARLRLQTREEIKRIQRETGITTIFVTHDQEEAMSISDEIVVMNYGVKQQVGEPQNVYNYPENEFVAKFLGTPPINLFEGKVNGNCLYINDTLILDNISVSDQDVIVGIRPEGFEINPKGTFITEIHKIETVGRDTTLICNHQGLVSTHFRIIVDSDEMKDDVELKFNVKPNKCHIFSKTDGCILK
ncbi:ABC transporter ATP-binding protein [Mycoplasmatota bacterium WC44]